MHLCSRLFAALSLAASTQVTIQYDQLSPTGLSSDLYQLTNTGLLFDLALGLPPNPCRDALVVRNAPAGARYAVLDAQGRTVAEGRWSTGDGRVTVEALVPGPYALVVADRDARTTGRFVKE